MQAPLDVWLVRKLGVPHNEEVAMGAIALGDQQYLDQRMIAYLNVPEDAIEQTIARETQELQRRNQLYRLGKALPQLSGLRVILVDDGLATGASMKVTVQSVRNAGAAEIIVAVPVGPANVCRELEQYVDRVLCLNQPHPFDSVSRWYGDFRQTTDDEVRHLLASQAWLEDTGTDERP